ncbi:MAG: hypothetical protein PHN84_12775 [Desulfuromonadaceae bacterium]|nr:hypothetical protein [Desulfuromonadaceae bacterium]
MPAGNLKSILVLPLAPVGQFALDRVILSNGTDSYLWGERSDCLRQALRDGLMTKEVCNSAAPVLTTKEDGSVSISSIPQVEYANGISTRMARALFFAIGIFLAGIWLLKSCGGDSKYGLITSCTAAKISWIILALLYVYQLSLVSRYGIDLPYEDEWDFFKAASLSESFSWRWLTGFHVEDRIILTRLMSWLNFKVLGLDFAIQKIFNMLIFGALIVLLTRFKERVTGAGNFNLFPMFLIFMLSMIARENHLWAFQGLYHLMLLFSVAALYNAFDQKVGLLSAFAFALCMILEMSTSSAWIVFVAVYLACITIFIISGISESRIERLAGLRFLLIVWSITIAGALLWFHGYVTSEWPPPKLYPTDIRFWEYYLNIISFGFGFDTISIFPGLLCVAIVVTPLVLLLHHRETRWQTSTWQVLTATLGILALLAAISVGRGDFGEPKTSRYSEIGFMLIPYAAMAWWLMFRKTGNKKYPVLLLILWLFCFSAYSDNWSTQKYAEARQINLYNLECVDGYYNGIGDGVCQGRTSASDLDRAKEMNVSFTRQFFVKR